MNPLSGRASSFLYPCGLLISLLLAAGACEVRAQTFSPAEYRLSTHRIGAFQCLKCPKGGFIEGVKSGDRSRVRREFSAIQQLCVASYGYVDDELYVYFALDSSVWPDGGSWGLKANSWNAECHLK